MAHLHLETSGTGGPRVLLIQGTGVRGRAWAPQVDGLKDEFELAWYDHRGIGMSPGYPTTRRAMAEDALAVLDDLGWDRAHLVGHSLGGVIALEAADLAPGRVRSLALLCSFLRGRAAGPTSPSKFWTALRTSIGTRAMRRRAFYQMVSDPRLAVTEQRMATLEAAFGRSLDALPTAAIGQLAVLLASDMTEAARRWSGPALVLSASGDTVSPPGEGHRLAAALGVHPEVMPGGHALTIQQAATVNERLRSFLRGAIAQQGEAP